MTDSPDLVFYGSPLSPFLRKCAAVASEKDVAFDIEAVNVFDPPEWFRDISPMKRIPVMRDRSVGDEGVAGTIADSSAICAYIEAKHPEPSLYCTDPYARGRALMIEEYADTMLAAAGGLGMFRPVFFNAMQGKQPDADKARQTWAEEIPPMLAFLDAELSGKTFCCEDRLSIADITVACVLMQIDLIADMSLGDYPALEAHYQAMCARPSIAGPAKHASAIVRKSLPDKISLS